MNRLILIALVLVGCTVEPDDAEPTTTTGSNPMGRPIQLSCDELAECLQKETPTCVLTDQDNRPAADRALDICEYLLDQNPDDHDECIAEECS